ncbi:hypothetical protein BH09ACT11_BH09ACT11_11330 [soil metagenome]
MFEGNTTWTVGRVLSSLVDTGTEVVIYAGPHRHRGSVRGVGEHLVTLENGDDLVAVSLPEVTGFHVLGGARGVQDDGWVIEDAPPARVEVRGSEPAGPTWFQPTPEQLMVAERERNTAKVQGWAREIITEAERSRS